MLGRIIVVLLALSTCTTARAVEFPSRTVTIVSPYQAGGTSDIIARILAQKLSEQWGKSVIVENRPGANGGIGVTAVTHAIPDGHTLLAVASSALTINPLFYPQLPYNVDRDLAPITRTGTVANVLVVNPSVPANSVQTLIALAKAKPGQLRQLKEALRGKGRPEQRQRIQMVLLRESGMTQPAIAEAMGVSLSTVNRAHMAYDHGGLKALKPKAIGGRQRENMTLAEEKALLNRFAKAAGAGEMLNIHDLKAAYEKAIGHETSNSTIYNLLARHGWRKLMPRPFHPKRNIAAQNSFKKTAFQML